MSAREFKNNRYVYSIRHLYGLEGGRIDHPADRHGSGPLAPPHVAGAFLTRAGSVDWWCVSPASCGHLVQQDCQVNDCNGCAFRTFDAAALRIALLERHSASAVDEICAAAAAGQFQV